MTERIIPTREELLSLYDEDAELLFEVVDVFLETVDDMLTRIDAAVDTGVGADVAAAAHGLKGAVVNFGADDARDRLRALEEAAHRGDPLDAPLSAAYDAVRAVVTALRALRRDAA